MYFPPTEKSLLSLRKMGRRETVKKFYIDEGFLLTAMKVTYKGKT
jgi:hypothetical protein